MVIRVEPRKITSASKYGGRSFFIFNLILENYIQPIKRMEEDYENRNTINTWRYRWR